MGWGQKEVRRLRLEKVRSAGAAGREEGKRALSLSVVAPYAKIATAAAPAPAAAARRPTSRW